MNTLAFTILEIVPPQIVWNPPQAMQDICTKIAFFVALVWIGALLVSVALPKGRSGGMMGQTARSITPMSMIGAGFAIIILLDLKLVPNVVNAVIQVFIYIWNIIFPA